MTFSLKLCIIFSTSTSLTDLSSGPHSERTFGRYLPTVFVALFVPSASVKLRLFSLTAEQGLQPLESDADKSHPKKTKDCGRGSDWSVSPRCSHNVTLDKPFYVNILRDYYKRLYVCLFDIFA